MAVAVVVVVLVGAVSRLDDLAASARLLGEAVRISRGVPARSETLGSLDGAVPVPPGYALLGVTRVGASPHEAVIGLSTTQDVRLVTEEYLAALEGAGWVVAGYDSGSMVAVLSRDRGEPSAGTVRFTATGPEQTTVVLQVR